MLRVSSAAVPAQRCGAEARGTAAPKGPPDAHKAFLGAPVARSAGAKSAGKPAAGAGTEVEAPSKSVEIMRKFSERYAQSSKTYFCVDKSVTATVIQGLAAHKDELGAPLCPCRHYDDKQLEAKNGYWNCPCVPMRERKECHCMLFLTEDNDFRGEDTTITMEEVMDGTGA